MGEQAMAIDPDALDAAAIAQLVDGLEPGTIDALARGLSGEALGKLIEKADPETVAKLIGKADLEGIDRGTIAKVAESLDAEGVNRLVASLDGAAINKLVAAAGPETARELVKRVDPGTFDLSAIDPEGIDPEVFDTEVVALVVRATPEEKLREAMAGGLRELILGELFRRIPTRLREGSSQSVEAAIEWLVPREDGQHDRHVVVIDRGTCRLEDGFAGVPRCTIEIGPVELLRVATGGANPVEMFMSGRLRVEGDPMFAAQLPALFDVPSPDAA